MIPVSKPLDTFKLTWQRIPADTVRLQLDIKIMDTNNNQIFMLPSLTFQQKLSHVSSDKLKSKYNSCWKSPSRFKKHIMGNLLLIQESVLV